MQHFVQSKIAVTTTTTTRTRLKTRTRTRMRTMGNDDGVLGLDPIGSDDGMTSIFDTPKVSSLCAATR